MYNILKRTNTKTQADLNLTKDSTLMFSSYLMIFISSLICMYPEISFAADTLEGMSEDVYKLYYGTLQKAVVGIGALIGAGTALITGSVAQAGKVMLIVVIITITISLNEHGVSLMKIAA